MRDQGCLIAPKRRSDCIKCCVTCTGKCQDDTPFCRYERYCRPGKWLEMDAISRYRFGVNRLDAMRKYRFGLDDDEDGNDY